MSETQQEYGPDAGGWIAWSGGECPVDRMTKVEVRTDIPLRSRHGYAGDFRWHSVPSWTNIIAYRVIELAPASAPPDDFLDRAALAAMTGLLASEGWCEGALLAQNAYDLATALSAERTKRLAARALSRQEG